MAANYGSHLAFIIRKPDTKSVQKMTIQILDGPVFGGSLYSVGHCMCNCFKWWLGLYNTLITVARTLPALNYNFKDSKPKFTAEVQKLNTEFRSKRRNAILN
jgi:hypothetical protein